jgi:hypothetical protein
MLVAELVCDGSASWLQSLPFKVSHLLPAGGLCVWFPWYQRQVGDEQLAHLVGEVLVLVVVPLVVLALLARAVRRAPDAGAKCLACVFYRVCGLWAVLWAEQAIGALRRGPPTAGAPPCHLGSVTGLRARPLGITTPR